jgi:hypothetical protein
MPRCRNQNIGSAGRLRDGCVPVRCGHLQHIEIIAGRFALWCGTVLRDGAGRCGTVSRNLLKLLAGRCGTVRDGSPLSPFPPKTPIPQTPRQHSVLDRGWQVAFSRHCPRSKGVWP